VYALDPALLTLAHEGAKVYSETYDLLYRREVEAPNTVWQADHTLLDIWGNRTGRGQEIVGATI
jgi:putative transposase